MRDRGIVVDRSRKVPLQRQLECSLRDAILSGRMRAGERVLSSRELQTHLGLSRNTIVNAIAQLSAEGYLESIQGVGTFVAETAVASPRSVLRTQRHEATVLPSEFATRSLGVRDLATNLSGSVPFRPGTPALDLFPAATFHQCLRAGATSSNVMDYPAPGGELQLREAIAQRLRQTRGVACSPDQIFVTGGAQAAYALIAHVMLERGSRVLTEEPGYPSGRARFIAVGADVISVAVDRYGLDVASIAGVSATLAHVSPSHQYPTGAIMPLERRFALLDWAEKHRSWILEDDYESEFNYAGSAHPAMFGLGDGERTIYLGTFSKAMSPALCVAYVVVPGSLRAAFEAVHLISGAQPSSIIQRALAKFIVDGFFARHITRMRKIYDERRKAMAVEFIRAFGGAAQIHDTKAGLHFTVAFPAEIPDVTFAERAGQAGYIVPALSSYYRGATNANGIVVGYAATSIESGRRAVRDLARLASRI